MSLVSTCTSSVCHSHVLACHPYVNRMYSYVILMSSRCTCVSFVCHHSYVLVCHCMWLVFTCIYSVCHSYVILSWTLSMIGINIFISLNLHSVYSLFLSFVFPLLRKSISVKEDYKASCAILSRGQIETTLFLDSWWMVKGVSMNLESLTYKYVRTDLNAFTEIFFSKTKEKSKHYLKYQRSSSKT